MKKLILSLTLIFAFMLPAKQAQAIDPKTKAFLIVCAYGTVGGALLGFASMAFGTNSRAIAQGASLGLYSGIIFGTYVLTSYNPNAPSPEYEYPEYDSAPRGGFGGFGVPADEEFANPRRDLEFQRDVRIFGNKKGGHLPPLYLNLVNFQF